jgi:hypothetical protein
MAKKWVTNRQTDGRTGLMNSTEHMFQKYAQKTYYVTQGTNLISESMPCHIYCVEKPVSKAMNSN